MRVAICDDDMREQRQFEEALRGWDPAQSAEKFFNGSSFLKAAQEQPHFDIVFLDIYMPGENGIDIAGRLREISPETGIVFVTVSREHAVEAFSLYAMHYLIKPVTAEGISEAFERLADTRLERRERITLTAGTDRHTVFLDQICVIESDNHMVTLTLADGTRLRIRMPFGELEKKMNKRFLRINRGIAVNMDYIAQMGKDTCVMLDGMQLPIAIRHSVAIRAVYDEYVFDQLSRRKGLKEM